MSLGKTPLAFAGSTREQPVSKPPALVAFDVDGTLLRGETVCECIGRGIGKTEEMRAFERLESQSEIAAARRTMLEWYVGHGRAALLEPLRTAKLAPRAKVGFARLRESGIKTALVSITWHFAVEWLAAELGADYAIGTGWRETGEVVDFWPDDKAIWLTALMKELEISPETLIAVGDSAGDIPMLRLAGRGYLVGPTVPEPLPHVRHWPAADIEALVDDMIRPFV
jgi:HAD superfamily phosphoserine phosphatase-like hydrolase